MNSFFYKLSTVYLILTILILGNLIEKKITIKTQLYNVDFHYLKTSQSIINSNSKFPKINAKYAVVFDRSSSKIIYNKQATEKCKIASTTKILTAILALEGTNLNAIITVSKNTALAPKSRIGLSTNDKISVKDLLYGLMLYSGNDAAIALAEHISGNVEAFSNLMNQKAKSLGMSNSNFITPNGLDAENHYSTAYDMALLANYALKNETFLKIVQTKNYTIKINNSSKNISNTHELLGNLDGFYGGKTGYTSGAGRCLLTACKRNNLDIICVVLGCDSKKDRTQDSIKLINYTFKNYCLYDIKNYISNYFNSFLQKEHPSFNINKGISNSLELYINYSNLPYTNFACKNSLLDTVYSQVSLASYFEAPLYSDSKIGFLTIYYDNEPLLCLEIQNKNEIHKKSPLDYLQEMISLYNY